MGDEAVVEEEVIEETDDFEAEFNKQAAERDGVKDEIDSPAGEEPGAEEETGEEEPGDVDGKGTEEEAAAAEEEKVDPYAGMDEATKARFIALEEDKNKLQHRIDSDDGRVGALQRKINGLEGDIQTIRDTSGKEQPSKEQIAEAMATDEGWNKFADDYPEVAAAIDGRLGKHQEAIDASFDKQSEQINNTLAPVVEKQEIDDTNAGVAAIADIFPKWQNEVRSKEFNDWLVTQPGAVQKLASEGDIDESISMLGMYDNHRIANSLPSLRKTDHEEPEHVVENQATELEQKRQQQLEDGATIPSKAARIDPSADSDDTFEAAFAVHAKRLDAKRQA